MRSNQLLYVFLLLCSCLFNDKPEKEAILIPFLKNELYGYTDTAGKVIIEPQYDQVGLFGHDMIVPDLVNDRHRPTRLKKKKRSFLPSNMAKVSKEGIWQIIDKQGEVLLQANSDNPIAVSRLTPRKTVNSRKKTSGKKIIYNYKFGGIEKGSWALYDRLTKSFRFYDFFDYCFDTRHKRLDISVGEKCSCLVAKRNTGTYDLLTDSGYLLKENIDPDYRCNTEPAAALCDKLYPTFCKDNPEVFPVSRYSKNRRKKNILLDKKYDNNKYKLTDSEGKVLSKKSFDAIEILGDSRSDAINSRYYHKGFKGAACLNKSQGLLEIYNLKGELIKVVQSRVMPHFENLYKLPGYLFINVREDPIFINEKGEEASLAASYSNIEVPATNCVIATIGKGPVPIHIYDADLKLKVEEEVHEIINSEGDLIAKVKVSDKQDFQYKLLNTSGRPYHLLEGQNLFDSIVTLQIKSIDPSNRKSDRILSIPVPKKRNNISDLKEIPAELKEILVRNGYDSDVKPNDFHPMAGIGRQFKENAYSSQYGYRLYITSVPEGKRFLIERQNEILMDTIAETFVSYNLQQATAKFLSGTDTLSVKMSKPNRKFYREYYRDSDIYSHKHNDTMYLKNGADEVLHSMPTRSSNNIAFQSTLLSSLSSSATFQCSAFSNNRFVLKVPDGFLVLDKQGEILDKLPTSFNQCTNLSVRSTSYKDLIIFSYAKSYRTCGTGRARLASQETKREKEFVYDIQKLIAFRE